MRQAIMVVGMLVCATTAASAGDANFDLGFGNLGVVTTTIEVPNIPDVAIQPDGFIVATGRRNLGLLQPVVARFDPTGAFDPSFGTGGIAPVALPVAGQTYSIVLQDDGKMLLAGTTFANALLVRIDANGDLDPSFGVGGAVIEDYSPIPDQDSYAAMALDPAGKVLAVGTAQSNKAAVARYLLSDGSLDGTFGTGGRKVISLAPTTFGGRVLRQPDGKILLAGSTGGSGPVLTLAGFIMRLDDAGSADGAFGTNGVVTVDFAPSSDAIQDMALQPDGRIVIAGDGRRDVFVARYTSSGALDPTFNAGVGYLYVDFGAFDTGRRIIMQPDGKIVIVGYSFAVLGQPSSGTWIVTRLLPDGTLDPTFGNGGRVQIALNPNGAIAYNAARQSDGKLVIAGLSGSTTTGPMALVRLGGDCGDGTVGGLEVCDDGNAVAGDCCNLACQPEPAQQPCPNSTSVCLAHRCDGAGRCGVPELASGCKLSQIPGQSSLVLKDAPSLGADILTWKYRKGDATSLEDLGDPYVSTTYALCGYGPATSLLFELDAPPGGLCSGRACWSLLGRTGFGYRDRDRTPSGLDLLRVRSGDAGRVSMLAKGKGSNLTLPPLPLALPATVQLRATDGACWETTFSATGVVRNDGTQFKGRAD